MSKSEVVIAFHEYIDAYFKDFEREIRARCVDSLKKVQQTSKCADLMDPFIRTLVDAEATSDGEAAG